MNIKKNAWRTLGISLVSLSAITLVYNNLNESKNENSKISDIRKSHTEYLQNSPFKQTLQLNKKERKAKGLPPNRYYEQMWELTINPQTGRTEPEKLYKLQEQLKNGLAKRAPGENGTPWIERGPNDIGGRTRAIMFDPNDANNRRVFAGGVSGGLWVNNDITSAASQWARVQNVPGNLSVTSITVDPRNNNTWYIGTGEQYTAGDVVGNGVYRSTDGGNTWQALNIPAAGGGNIDFNANNLFLSGIYYVNDIVAWNNTAQNRTELFVGVGAHVYGDAATPTNWLGIQSAGIYRSTDGGANWNRIESANMRYTNNNVNYYYVPNDFEIAADNRLWMGTINSPFGQGGGRVYSTNDGATWTEAAASPLNDSNRVELETSATDANKIYALTQGVAEDASGNVIDPVHIYRSTDGFATAPTATSLPNDVDTGIAANDFTRGQAFYDLMIEADPGNDDILYVGGIDLFRSANGGNSWSQISKWSNNNNLARLGVSLVHADQHAMVFRPGNSNQAVFGNDGGVYYASSLSTAGNSDVFGARVSNYNVTQYVKAGIGPNGAGDAVGIFTAGAQDNGSQAFRNAVAGINGSEELSDGDGFYTFVDKDGQYMTATFTNNIIYRYNLPWDGRGRRQGGATTLVNERSGDFVNQMGYDSDANFILSNATASGDFKIKTIDVANNRNNNIDNAMLTNKPTAFIASPFANNTWYVGAADGKLFRLTNVGLGVANWAEINTPFVGSVSSVRFGETANDLLVTIHNYGVTSIWYSSDAGTNWVSKEGDFPDIPVRDILQNPLDRTEVIVATQLGVWVSNNFDVANPSWSQAYNGMSDASVTSFDYWAINGDDNNNIVIASTYGRGVFTGSFSANVVADTQAPTAPTNLTASNVAQTSVDLSWTASTDNVAVTAYDVYQNGSVIATVNSVNRSVTGLNAGTTYTFKVRAKDAAGNVSTDSNVVNITTTSPDNQAPTAPANLTAANITENSVDLSWTAATDNIGVSGYDVFRGTTLITTVTSTNYAATGLSAATSYTFKVRAKDAAGNVSADSNTVNVTTSAATADPCNGGATLTTNTGTFEDGSGNADYGNNKNCTWVIKPANGGTVTLNFDSFNTESGYDFVTVYDGETTSASQLGRFSGTSIPAAVTSSGNAMLVQFTSDGSVVRAGWAARFTSNVAPPPTCNDGIQNGDETGVDCGGSNCAPCSTPSDPCNGGATLTAETGSFEDGSGTSDYTNNRDCTWLIKPSNGGRVTLNFNNFNTESGYDFVTVYDGETTSASQLGRFSGTATPAAVTSTGNAMLVRFTSDGSVVRAGWAASYTSNSSGGGSNGCTGGITSYPYNEGFESGLGGWTQGSGDDFDWTRHSGTTRSSGTGPSGAQEGTYYVYVETSSPNNPNKTTILNSPCFDLSGKTTATFTFRYQMTGNAVGELKLEASNNNAASWTSVWSISGNQGSAWNTANVDLNTYVGNSVQLRFTGTSGTSWQGDIAVDNIVLTAAGNSSSFEDTLLTLEDKENASFDFKFYPNPVTGNTMYMTTPETGNMEYKISNLMGQTVMVGKVINKGINVQNLPSGVYLVEVSTQTNDKVLKQFVKE